MKRLVKVRIRAGDRKAGEEQLIYPAVWNAKEIDQYGGCSMLNPPLYTLDVCMTGDVGRGGSEQWIVVALPEAVALVYAEDPDVAIIESVEADTIMEGARVGNNLPVEITADDDKVKEIRGKQGKNEQLTPDELAALDPDNPMKGINKARRPSKIVMPDIDDNIAGIPANKKEIQRG